MMKEPLVSICCLAYNHEPFIRQCLDGFMMQKTNFLFEVLIHDDASTDKTADIIREFEAKYPDIIKPIYQIENQYSKGTKNNIAYNFPRARGKFIALCEGDDYWTDPYKLQKQVDFLEANKEFIICFHKIKILKNNWLVNDYITNTPKNESTINDIANENYIHTPSVLFRNGFIKEFPDWYLLSPIGDHPLYILLAQYGKIKYIDKCMAVYRIHKGGNWSHRNVENINLFKRIISTQKLMIDYFEGDVKNILINKLSLLYLDISEIYLKKNRYDLSLEAFKESTSYTFDALHIRYFKYKLFGEKFKNLLIKNPIFPPFLIKIIKRKINNTFDKS